MKVLIEIDEKFYQWVKMCGIMPFITQGKVIPDNATNGDVINTLFSDIGITQTDPYTGIIEIDLDWWNAPYKGGE